MNKNSNHSFIKDFFSLGIGSFLYLIIGLLGTPIITRLVDPVDYGQMSLLTVYSNLGMILCGLGLDQTLMRFFYQDKDIQYRRSLLKICYQLPLIVSIASGSLFLIAYALGLRWISLTELVLLWINVIALLFNRISMLLLRMQYRTNAHSIINIIQKTTYILLTVTLVLTVKTNHFIILAVSTIASSLIAALLSIFFERDHWHLPDPNYVFPIRHTQLLKYSLPFMLSGGINVIFNALDKLFIDHFCTMTDVGIYASAMNMMAIFAVVRTSFNAIWMPSAVDHYETNPDDKSFFQSGHSFISILMLCFGATVILCKDLFVLLLGSRYQSASVILPYLMFEPIMYTISETTATGIVVQKKSSYQLIVSGVSCLVNFVGNWILTPLMGPQGAALSTGLSYIVFFILRTSFANRVFYVDYGLPRLTISVSALLAFAVFTSNTVFSLWYLIGYFLVMTIIIIAYRKNLRQAIQYAGSILNKVLKKT